MIYSMTWTDFYGWSEPAEVLVTDPNKTLLDYAKQINERSKKRVKIEKYTDKDILVERVIYPELEGVQELHRQGVLDFINGRYWKSAKTYADWAPHQYTVLSWNNDKPVFLGFVKYLFDNGIPMYFGNTCRKYLYIKGHYYWTMDPTIEKTDLINRSNVDDYGLKYRKYGKK